MPNVIFVTGLETVANTINKNLRSIQGGEVRDQC